MIDYAAAAKLLGLKLGTLRSLVSRGQIPHARITARLVLFDENELRAWLDSKRVGVKPKLSVVNDRKGAA